MKYIKKFENHDSYESFITSGDYRIPNISYCVDRNEVHYNDYSKEYLTFVAKANGTFKFSGTTTANTVSYSLDNGSTWSGLTSNTNSQTVTSGQKIMWKGTLTPTSNKGIGRFSSTAQFDVEGNPMSLLFGDDFKEQTSLKGKNHAFYNLFSGCTMLVSAENLSLPATTLTDNCYQGMFNGCTSLTTAPELPATTLADTCYRDMFEGCTSLTTAPELLATTLTDNCYQGMFNGCTSLTTAPELPATTLADNCYTSMFQGCTSLTTAPELPAKTLADTCYSGMFRGCTALITAPELLATTLANQCYSGMFYGCTSLTTAPQLPATKLAKDCYGNMFNDCSKLNYIKAMFTTKPSTTYTDNWVYGVASSGTFVKNSAATWNISGSSGVPSGWTVETETPAAA